MTLQTRRKQASVLLSAVTCYLSVGVLIPVLPRYLTGPLGQQVWTVGVTIAVPSIVAILVRPFAGRMTDTRGRRWSVAVGAGVFLVSALGLFGAVSLPLLLAVRALAGVGEAFVFVGLATAASDLAPPGGTSAVMNRYSIMVYIGLLVGPLLGETARTMAGFWAVWVLSAVTAAAGLVACRTISRMSKLDSPQRTSMIYRPALLPGFAYCASIWGYTAFSAFLPLLVVKLGGANSTVHFLAYGCALLAVRVFGHRVFVRLAPRHTAVLSLALTGLGVAGLAGLPSLAATVAATAVLGAGQALGFPAFMAMAVDGVPAERRGAAVATVTAFFDVGFLTAALGLGAVTQSLGIPAGFATSGLVVAGALLLFLPRGRRPA